jgi:hypothetical protein
MKVSRVLVPTRGVTDVADDPRRVMSIGQCEVHKPGNLLVRVRTRQSKVFEHSPTEQQRCS